MFYEFDVTVPPNTLRASPVIVPVEFVAGAIVGVHVQIPLGCRALAHTAAYNELHQVWPANQDGDIKGDGAIVSWPEDYEVPSDNYQLQIYAWSDDDTFAHTLTWRFAFQTAAERAQQNTAMQALNYLAKWFAQQGGASVGGA
ncbi:MAG: hypothetical protein IVW53_15435 [Chloroflexi bacterium]|nr:hypothetical protein [Chloroflexota bacterium]